MNGSISVFSINTGGVINVLENEETISESMPISRLRCKPSGDNNVTILAATYVSGHLRYNISMSAIICKQIMQYIFFSLQRLWNYANGQCLGSIQDENKDAEYLSLSYNPFADGKSFSLVIVLLHIECLL